ncbi:MAG TPA: aldo/keto reductase [Bryobacteraceae bacterium]
MAIPENAPSRREFLKAGVSSAAAAAVTLSVPMGSAQTGALIQKKIPSSGESLPIIGIGTARRYDVPPDAPQRAEIKEVLRQFASAGGRVIDTAPAYPPYGAAEEVVGTLTADLGIRKPLFLATKVNARGREAGIQQLQKSMERLRTTQIDLVAVHNLTDTATQLATLREWKDAGKIRYVGLTTSSEAQYTEFERMMKAEKLDFIQVDYALDVRRAAERILPLAAERGMAVMTNLPFGRGRLFQAVQSQKLPEWAAEIDCTTWAQVFLKYLVSHPAVTVAIPGTAQVKYVADNLGAARGRLADAPMRKRMESFIDSVKA